MDRIYIHKSQMTKIETADVTPIYFSDHDLFQITMKTEKVTDRLIWGHGIWKYNSNILTNKENLRIIKEKWIEWDRHKDEFENILDWWETGKRKIMKQTCIELGEKDKKERFRGI